MMNQKQNQQCPQKRTGRVSIYINPFNPPNQLPIQVGWEHGRPKYMNLLRKIKPLPGDMVSEDGSIYQIEDRTEKIAVVYIDHHLLPHVIYGKVPYDICVRNTENIPNPNTFWVADLPVDQNTKEKAFEICLKSKFQDEDVPQRETQMVKVYYRLPEKSPEASKQEISDYHAHVEKVLKPENLRQIKDINGWISEIQSENQRYDFTNSTIFSIDGEKTQDIDDAIEVVKMNDRHFLLGVHIADVSELIPKGSFRDKDAQTRSTTTYLATEIIQMLPECLAHDLCSLKENENRLTLSVYADIEITGAGYEIKGIKIAESVIRNKAKLVYDDVDEILEGRQCAASKKIQASLLAAKELATIIKKSSLYNQDAQNDEKSQNDEKGFSHTLIEMFMITANRLVGEKIADSIVSTNSQPAGIGVYRVQLSPSEKELQQYLDKLKSVNFVSDTLTFDDLKTEAEALMASHPALIKTIKTITNDEKPKLLNAVIYSLIHEKIATDDPNLQQKLYVLNRNAYVPGTIKKKSRLSNRYDRSFHDSLKINRYAWFTSPIRRYPDIINHRVIKSLIHGITPAKSEINISDLAKTLKQSKDAEKSLRKRLRFYHFYNELKNQRSIPIKIFGFEWKNKNVFILKGFYNDHDMLMFKFRKKPANVSIKLHGLNCQMGNIELNIGDMATVELNDPEKDICPEKGEIYVDDILQIRKTGGAA